jgi:tRNA (cytidine/uridine-2'-O-)-methyltransferase
VWCATRTTILKRWSSISRARGRRARRLHADLARPELPSGHLERIDAAEHRPSSSPRSPATPARSGAPAWRSSAELVLIRPLGVRAVGRPRQALGARLLAARAAVRIRQLGRLRRPSGSRAPTSCSCSRSTAPPRSTTPTIPRTRSWSSGRRPRASREAIWRAWPGRQFHLPMRSDKIRSLNLANTVAAAAYQAMRGPVLARCEGRADGYAPCDPLVTSPLCAAKAARTSDFPSRAPRNDRASATALPRPHRIPRR